MPQDQDKDLNRGGTMGQEGDLPGVRPQQKPPQKPQQQPEKPQQQPEKRDQQKQQGGIGREPRPDEKQQIQPEHEVD